jgi:hypothetical protein
MQSSQISDDIALLSYPFRVFGIDFARNVALLRLADGRIVIHSTAPFTASDVAAIRNFGEPAWLLDVTLMHDTFARQGHAAFPGLPYLAPEGFDTVSGVPTKMIDPPPADWAGQIDVLSLGGLRKREHAIFHRASRTLIVADMIFNFSAENTAWARFFVRHVMRLPRLCGISVFFKMLIQDRRAFRHSIGLLMQWEFNRMIVAHRDPVLSDAKSALHRMLDDAGLAPI